MAMFMRIGLLPVLCWIIGSVEPLFTLLEKRDLGSLFAGSVGRFVSDHPSIKIPALSFLVVVGVLLLAEGFDYHVPKGYVYFAMAFSLGAEILNIRRRKGKIKPVHLREEYSRKPPTP
jgi:predicted tellurium resistance membrane protein TerC